MKIPPPGTSRRPPRPSGAAGKASKSSGVSPGKAGDFADKVDQARAQSPTAPSRAAAARASAISDISADLRAARITPQAAIDKVIDRIVAQQLGIHATPAAAEQIGAALRERLADDPLLAAKVRALSEDV